MSPYPRPPQHTLAGAAERGLLVDGSVLLFRGRSRLARAIQLGGRSEYSHAAMLATWMGQPLCLEVRELRGGRVVTLESQVRRYSGQIDLYAVAPMQLNEQRRAAVRAMVRFAGEPYGYAAVAREALLHLPVVRWWTSPSYDDQSDWDGSPPYCSQAVAIALRAGGVDPVPRLADTHTEPGDLARSSALELLCTLVA